MNAVSKCIRLQYSSAATAATVDCSSPSANGCDYLLGSLFVELGVHRLQLACGADGFLPEQHATCNMQQTSCNLQDATNSMNTRHTTGVMQHATDNMHHATCNMQQASCDMQKATGHVSLLP
jgi:hypothetical protein